ncbi:MAG: RNase adapter RapZ [Lautropia sp.]
MTTDAAQEPPQAARAMQLVFVTGISGSGKSLAIRVLEDAGFFCLDNLPVGFLAEVIASLERDGHDKVAVAVDVRTGRSIAGLREVVEGFRERGNDVKVLFLNARTDVLVQRYSETRRRHPLTLARRDALAPGPTLSESIEQERELLSGIGELGIAIDTSDLHPNVLRHWVREVAQVDRAVLTLLFESFAFKHGVPLDADLVFDVRCLPNPYYESALRPLTGLDAPVAAYLDKILEVGLMIDDISRFLENWLPQYVSENRHYLTVAIGCTGGQHRSVYVVDMLAKRFAATERVLARHRALANRGEAALAPVLAPSAGAPSGLADERQAS